MNTPSKTQFGFSAFSPLPSVVSAAAQQFPLLLCGILAVLVLYKTHHRAGSLLFVFAVHLCEIGRDAPALLVVCAPHVQFDAAHALVLQVFLPLLPLLAPVFACAAVLDRFEATPRTYAETRPLGPVRSDLQLAIERIRIGPMAPQVALALALRPCAVLDGLHAPDTDQRRIRPGDAVAKENVSQEDC